MTDKVSGLSMAFMALSAAFSFIIPIALLVYFRRFKKAEVPPFFIGCAVFVLFAMIIEGFLNNLILVQLPIGEKITANTWLFALFGGLMAGIFEETGRFIAFKTVMKKYRPNDANALMYGAGHGGIEAMLLVGLSMISNLAFAVMYNSGGIDALSGAVPAEAAEQITAAVETLVATSPYMFLFGIIERIFAISVHIALSVLVWFAVKERGRGWLFPLAIAIHAIADGVTVIMSRFGAPTAAMEAVIGAIAVGTAVFAKVIWKNRDKAAEL